MHLQEISKFDWIFYDICYMKQFSDTIFFFQLYSQKYKFL